MILEKIGVFGMGRIERAILAGIVSGEPVLLVGSHGTAKTMLCRRLAGALGLTFWAYDASKAMFEDVIGFPSPRSLNEGELEYAPTPVSIWGKQFVLIDELSRATPSMQNKWFEVIRSRRIMGKALPDLKHVFSAMNPPTYLGAHPLDEALAGRFAIIATVPEVGSMERGEMESIIRSTAEEDAPGFACARRAGPARPACGAALPRLVRRARREVASMSTEMRSTLQLYVAELALCLRGREIDLDGRRLGMMYRSLMAYLATGAASAGRSARSSATSTTAPSAACPSPRPIRTCLPRRSSPPTRRR